METIWQPTEHKSLADIVAFTDERILDEGSELDLLSLAARFRQGKKHCRQKYLPFPAKRRLGNRTF